MRDLCHMPVGVPYITCYNLSTVHLPEFTVTYTLLLTDTWGLLAHPVVTCEIGLSNIIQI